MTADEISKRIEALIERVETLSDLYQLSDAISEMIENREQELS